MPSPQRIEPEVARRQLVEERANVPFDSRRVHHSTRRALSRTARSWQAVFASRGSANGALSELLAQGESKGTIPQPVS